MMKGALWAASLLAWPRAAAADGPSAARWAVAEADASEPSGLRLAFPSRYGPSSASSVAWAEYREEMNATGWSRLELQADGHFGARLQARAAGLVEGALTRERLDEYLANVGPYQDFGQDLRRFIESNTRWVKSQTRKHRGDTFWDLVDAAYVHLEGLLEGYNLARQDLGLPPVHWDEFYALTLNGDLDDLCEVFECNGRLRERIQNTSNTHCSALIRLTEREVFMGHSTWTQFEQMTRIYKLYDFGDGGGDGAGPAVAFPSYPGLTVSIDDFYQTSSGLVVIETTNANANEDLWKLVKPEALLYWVRAYVANRMADSGPAWASAFARHNSGTYNNQWMIVDTKLLPDASAAVKLNATRLPRHTLTVSELLPGKVHTEDMTEFLEQHGYWISYNRPFFKDIFETSGQPALVKRYGDHFSWERTARGQIFRRLMPSVVDEASFRRVMRYNDFKNDPVGMQGCKHGPSASNAIAERGDLTDPAAGCIDDIQFQDEAQTDVKYTTATLMREGALAAVAQSGPSYDAQPPFRWSASPFAAKPHVGQPDLWQFPWVNITWRHGPRASGDPLEQVLFT